MKRATQLTFGSRKILWPWICIYIVKLSVQVEAVADQGVFEFGNPVIFVTTHDQDFHEYRRIEKIENTYVENEYMMYRSDQNQNGTKKVLRMVMYDPANTKDVIQQNWGKEQYWAFVNSTGVLPSMTISNTTTKATSTFYTEANNYVQFYADLTSTFSTKDTVPPIDVLFEIPAESKSFRQRKTLIDYSSWGVLRWTWGTSNKWTEIKKTYRARTSDYKIKIIATPCLPDLFILYVVLEPRSPGTVSHVFLNIPAISINEDYGSTNFVDITDSLCPDQTLVERCSTVEDINIILTNKYMIALNKLGVFISKDLTSSTKEPFSDNLPPMAFTKVDPCAGFTSKLGVEDCFKESTYRQKLFYTPVCSLYQVPNYDDIVIMSIQIPYRDPNPSNVTGNRNDAFKTSVFFSYSPYTKWLPLFLNEMKYNGKTINRIVGIIFNHQLRHFDITVELEDNTIVDGDVNVGAYATRFVLPIPEDLTVGHAKISDTRKAGFIDFSFPKSFTLTEVTMHPVTMDIFFMGTELWIAESAGPIVYLSMGSFPDNGKIADCRFNHPDRYFVCAVERDTTSTNGRYSDIVVGRTAHQYSLVNIKTTDITEISQFVGKNGLLWPTDYIREIATSAVFTVSFSGNILLWYLFDPQQFVSRKNVARERCRTGMTSIKTDVHSYEYAYCEPVWKEMLVLGTSWTSDVPQDKTIPHFRMMSLNPLKFDLNRNPTHGPLTPFFIDSTNAILFEGIVPAVQNQVVQYISAVNIGQKIQCPRDTLDKTSGSRIIRQFKKHEKYDCDMYVRHIKNVAKYLPGFRQALFVSISKSIPMKIIQDRLTIEFEKNSNFVVVTLFPEVKDQPTKMNFSDGIATEENYAIIGQSIYVPGKFSILIKGFPNMAISKTHPEDKIRQTSVWGYATVSETKERKEEIGAYDSWLIDLSTCEYRKARSQSLDTDNPSLLFDANERKKVYLDRKRYVYIMNKEYARQRKVKEEINRERGWIGLGDLFTTEQLKRPKDLDLIPYTSFTDIDIQNVYDDLHCEHPRDVEDSVHHPWVTGDGGCQHIMILQDNPVLKGHGGRVNLDRLDSVSFVVRILPISQIGNLMLYRPMIVVTNSNPEVLTVDRIFTRGAGYQTMKVSMRPTGVRTGVSTVSIRSIVASIRCETPSSMTFVVSAHREEGRRLHVNYPHPICNNDVAYRRPWNQDPPKCITVEEIADPKLTVIKRDGEVVFSRLPRNYRPPSVHGAAIPMSENVYNADPSAPMFNEYYTISKTSRKYDDNFCANKPNREMCNCKESDKIQEDPIYSDCKEMVYTSKRGVDIPISIEYDPIMRDEDQLDDFRTKRTDLYVYIKEINNRVEFSVVDAYEDCVSGDVDESRGIVKCNEVLKEINNASHLHLNEGNKFLDAKSLKFILYGTGLFHFKVGLGKFDTFDEVTGYFTLFSASEDLNDVKLMVVMFLTLSFCFVLLFCGFLHVRKRLTAHLPYNDERPNNTEEDGQRQGQGNSVNNPQTGTNVNNPQTGNNTNNPQTGNNANNPDETGRGTKRKNSEEAGKGKKAKEEAGKGTTPKNPEDTGKVKVE